MKYTELIKQQEQDKKANAADDRFTGALQTLALLLNARQHPLGWKSLNFKHTPNYRDGSYAIDAYYKTDKGKSPLNLSDDELDLFDEHVAPYLTYRKYKSMKGSIDPKGNFRGDFEYEKKAGLREDEAKAAGALELLKKQDKKASLAANMLAGAIIGGAVGSGTGLAQHGLAAGSGQFSPDVRREQKGTESLTRQFNDQSAADARAKNEGSLYTRLGGGLTAGTLYGAGAGALYTAIEDWLTKKRDKSKQQETQE